MDESRRLEEVHIGRGRPKRWQTVFGIALLGVTLLWAIANGFQTHALPPPEGGYYLNALPALPWWLIVRPWLLWGWLGSAVSFALSFLLPIVRRRGSVTLSDDALVVELENGKRQTIAREDVLFVQPFRQHIVVRLRNGEELCISNVHAVDDGALVRLWYSAFPDSWTDGPGRVPIRSAAMVDSGGCVAIAMWLTFGIALLSSLTWVTNFIEAMVQGGVAGALRGMGWAAFAGVLAFVAQRSLQRRQLVIGTDGVRVVGALRDRFVPFSSIERVETMPSAPFKRVRLRLREGKRVHIPVIGDPEELALRLRDALDAWHKGDAAQPLDLLERGERKGDEWVQALRARATDASYREAGLRVEDLEALVDDPRAAPEQRVGASLALAADERGRRRVRIAASACADPDMQAALEAASEGELAERELERAVQRRAG
jgi:hypothetical protein